MSGPRSRRRTTFPALIGAGALALSGFVATGDAPAEAASGPAQHVIVLLKDQLPSAPAGGRTIGSRVSQADHTQAPLIAAAKRNGARDVRQLHVANAFAATMSSEAAATLRGDAAVAAVVPDRLIARPTIARERPSSAARDRSRPRCARPIRPPRCSSPRRCS